MALRCWFFWALWLLLMLAVRAADQHVEGCSGSAKRCGNLTISNPFWLTQMGMGRSCGSPEFEVDCRDNSAVLRSSGSSGFVIIGTTYEDRSLRVVDLCKLNNLSNSNGCHVPRWNTSAKLAPPFRIDPVNLELVFYNCTTATARRDRALADMGCGNGSNTFVRVGGHKNGSENYEEYYVEGCTPAFLPVMGSSSGEVNATNYKQLIKNGFLLTWDPSPPPPTGIVHHQISYHSHVPNQRERSGLPPACRLSVVPVLGFTNDTDYVVCMRQGYLLEWTVASGNCARCLASGGQCRYRDDGTGFSCNCSGAMYPDECGSKGTGTKILLIALTSAAAALLFPCIYVLIRHRRGKRLWFLLCKKTSSSTEMNYEAMIVSYGSLAPKRYMYSEVMKITSFRSDQLGRGGYGVVFKGRLHDGRLVAVKFLHDYKGNGDEFVNEVMSIGRTSHINVVSLFGFCLEGSKRALIYEYMSNGSLDKYIYSENPKEILGWENLYGIAIGIARGLEYLHHSCNTRIVHFDIKPQNILLDKDFCPKIADFGLAKLSRTKESKLSMTGARGTIGFIAPEVHTRTFGVVSTKSDIYSYGMMLLEMVGGRKNVNSRAENSSEQYFPDWIYDHFAQDDGFQACDVISENEEIAKKMTFIGLWCIQILPIYRPTIAKVLEMFERSLDEMEMPPKQNFSGLLEDSAHNMTVQSASSTIPEDTSLVNSENLHQLPSL